MDTIDPDDAPVKGTRRYTSVRRTDQARRTRERVLDHALALFLAQGYGPTTVDAVATGAGVSVETVYKAFGSKAGLVRELRLRALLGAGPIPAERRSDEVRDRATDPHEIIDEWARLQIEVMPRVAPILLVVRSAAEVDADLVALRDELDGERATRMAGHARNLADRGLLRAGVTVDQARDVMFAMSSPELYELLVLRQGWPLAQYGGFVGNAMASALLDERLD